MVFKKPNPFPKSIKDNLTFGMKVNGLTADDEGVEAVLRRASLWDGAGLPQDRLLHGGRSEAGQRYGVLAEQGDTAQIFASPRDERTQDHITGRFG